MKYEIDALELLTRLAEAGADGHFTILKFTTNWRVALKTPNLYTGDGSEEIQRWATGQTLDEAITNLLVSVAAEGRDRRQTEAVHECVRGGMARYNNARAFLK